MTLAYPELSRRRLKGVHPDLTAVVDKAISTVEIPVLVVEGKRTLARQKQLVRRGASQTMNSRHLSGHAVDLVAVDGRRLLWNRPHYEQISAAMKQAAAELEIDLEWGGDWRSFKDTPHYQLAWAKYPKDDTSWHDQVEEPETAKEVLAKGSRKYKTTAASRHVVGGLTVAGLTAEVAKHAGVEKIQAAKTYLDLISGFVSAYGFPLLIGAGVAGWLITEVLLRWQEEDVESGRYEPGSNEAGGDWK